VAWTPIPERWLPHARFSHLDHSATACLDCHAAAAASTVAADVLLPSIEVCRRCHGGDGAAPAGAPPPRAAAGAPRGAPAGCISCHGYHPSPPPAARAASLTAPAWGDTVAEPHRGFHR
jgi:hypothetical protein